MSDDLVTAAREQGAVITLARVGTLAQRALDCLSESNWRESESLLQKALTHAGRLSGMVTHPDAAAVGDLLRLARMEVQKARSQYSLLGTESALPHVEQATEALEKAIVSAPAVQPFQPPPPAIHGAAWHATHL